MTSIEELENLLDGIGKGERDDFLRLYTLTAAKLFGLCETILDDRFWASEVLERIYLRLWSEALDWRADQLTALTWIVTLARTEAVAARRAANKDNPPDPVELQKLRPPAIPQSEGQGIRPLFYKALSWLPADRQEAFLLVYYSGAGYADLATRYRVPFATVRNWQRRSLERLYNDLTKREASADVVLAGEFILGLLPDKGKIAFETRLSKEAALGKLIAGWCEDIVVLTDNLPEITPPSELFEQLDHAIFKSRNSSLIWRLGIVQAIAVAGVAALFAWLAFAYWPGMQNLLTNEAVIDRNNINTPASVVYLEPLPDTGQPVAKIDGPTGLVQVGGELPPLDGIPNLSAYLDFGGATEWVYLGQWPAAPPYLLVVPVELVSISAGSELVVLGGEGSDQEILRLTVE